MEYVRVCWPESQMFMELTEDEIEECGIELGEDCSYFIPEDVYDEVYKIAEDRMYETLVGSQRDELPWDYGKHFD